DERIDLRLFEFSVTETPQGDDRESYLVHDLNVFTYTELKSGEALVEKSPESEVDEVVVLTDSDEVEVQLEGKTDTGNWEEFPESYKGKLIEADFPETYQAIRIKPGDNLKVYEVIWK